MSAHVVCLCVAAVSWNSGRGRAMTVGASDIIGEAELDAFLNMHGDRIYTYLCILCRDEDAASDAMQNAYVKFLVQVRRGKVLRATAPQYLQTIAKHDYFGRLRKESREAPFPEDAPDHAGQRRANREELARELRLILLETIEDPGLPEDLAMVIRLRFLEEAEIDSICRRTGRSQSTVYRLMENALSILAEACRKAGLHLEDLNL